MEKPIPRIYLAIPAYRNVDAGFMECLLELQRHNPQGRYTMCKLDLLVGDSLVSRARNTLTCRFLKSDATHLLFIDSDLIFSGAQIDRLVDHNKDIVAGLYCKKCEGDAQLVMNKHGYQTDIELDEDRVADVAYVGTGFMLIKREVFEKIKTQSPQNDYIADESNIPEHDFWQVGVYAYKDGTKRYLSEDWYFCQKALDARYKVYADTHILARHVGHAIYPLKTQEAGLFGSSEVNRLSSVAAQNGGGETPSATFTNPNWHLTEPEEVGTYV